MKSNSLKTADLSAKTHVFNCVQSVGKFLENTLRSVYTVLIIEGSRKTVLQSCSYSLLGTAVPTAAGPEFLYDPSSKPHETEVYPCITDTSATL